jgi:Fe2+ or Zn2+ uptake regulation protein
VYGTLHARLPGLSRTTVYRVLETLVGQGFAHKVPGG